VKLRILGETSAEVEGRPLESDATHVLAALLVLALAPQQRVTRKRLAVLLWPDAPAQRQAGRLRWLLSKLRSLGARIESSPADVSLAESSVEVDYRTQLAALRDAAEQVDEGALDAIHAVFPDYAPDFSAPFKRWVEEQRDTLTDELLTHLMPLLATSRQYGDWEATERIARVVIRVSPLHDEATLALAEALCANGDKSRGLAILDEYLELVDEEQSDLRLPAELLRRRMRAPEQQRGGGARHASIFVGRRESLRRFHALLAEAAAGRGGAMLVAGPPGIGKTRLLDEMAMFATTLRSACVVHARCHAGDTIRPLSGLIDLIPKLLELPGAAGCEPANFQRLAKLSAVDEQATAQAALPENAAAMPGARDWLLYAVLDLIAAISDERTLVIEVDDFQWSNSALAWLFDVVLPFSASRRIVWCFAARSENADTALQHFSHDTRPYLRMEWLAGLETSEARLFLDELLAHGRRTASADTRDALLMRGGGIPLVLQEVVRHWQGTGDLASVPSTLSALIEARLAGLTASARRTLQVAALLGAHSQLDRLERILQLPRSDFVNSLAQLENAGILTTDGAGATHGHVLWAETAVEQLEPSVARVLHRHIAEDLESEMANAPSVALLWETARHWTMSGQSGQALVAITGGAEHLARNRLFTEAAEAYGRALDMSVDAVEQRRFLRRRIELLRIVGHWTKMLADIDRHEEVSAALDPLYNRHNELEMLRHSAHYGLAGPVDLVANEALQCARDVNTSASHRLQASFNCARYAQAATLPDLMTEAYRISSGLVPVSVQDRRHQRGLEILYQLTVGEPQKGLETALASVAAEREYGDPYFLAWTTRTLGWAMRVTGDIEHALRTYLESVAIARDAGLVAMLIAGYEQAVELSVRYDDARLARELLDRAEAECGPRRYFPTVRVIFPMNRAQLAIEERDVEQALRLVPRSVAYASRGPLGRSDLASLRLALRLLVTRTPEEEAEKHALAEQLLSCFVIPSGELGWQASIYAEYLDNYRGQAAANDFVRRYLRDIRRELGPPERRLAPFVARIAEHQSFGRSDLALPVSQTSNSLVTRS
jgi:DNA-binding SARP family transcriptional activator